MPSSALIFPEDFDDYAGEVEAKGWHEGAILSAYGKRYRLHFFDLGRLHGEIESEFQRGGVFFEPNLVVVSSVTRANMERAAEFLIRSGQIASLIAESEQTVSFVRSIVARFPSLNTILEDHIKKMAGKILPQVLFRDITRGVIGGGLLQQRELRDILNYLEEAYAAGDQELQELISVSVLANLPYRGESGAEVRKMLGPNLRRELQTYG